MSRVFCSLTLTSIALLSSSSIYAQNKISNFDFSFQYDINSELRGDIYAVTKDSISTLFIKYNSPQDSLKKYKVGYSLVNKLDEDLSIMAKMKMLSSYFQFEDSYGAEYGLRIRSDGYKYIVLWLSDTIRSMRYPYVKMIRRLPETSNIVLEAINMNSAIYRDYL